MQTLLILVAVFAAVVACMLLRLRTHPLPNGRSPWFAILVAMASGGMVGLGTAGCGMNFIFGPLLFFPGLWLSSIFDPVDAWGQNCGAGGPEHPGQIIFWNTIAGVAVGACCGMLFVVLSGRRSTPDGPARCPCGYDLTGNVSGTCPECGEPAR